MENGTEEKPIRGFLFPSTDKTEGECFERALFSTDHVYGPIVLRIRPGDLLFLNNLDSNVLYGVFRATSDGQYNIEPEAWDGKYPYQVRVEEIGEKIELENASKLLKRFDFKRNKPLIGEKLVEFLEEFSPRPTLIDANQGAERDETIRLIDREKSKVRAGMGEVDIMEEIPLVEPTTLWDFPQQDYGVTSKGDNKYPGVTPALLIYNLVWRYTDPGDLVVDPMCGSGTTIDVCRAEKRKVIGYDISPVREDIEQNDARSIPLEDESVDLVFVDSPYGDNVEYNDHPASIGKISAETNEFYDELEEVMDECHRILEEGKVLGWLIGDQWVKKKFTPVGLKIYDRLCKYFKPIDIISVARRGQSSHTGLWVNRARRHNFYLRGFKYLHIMRKTSEVPSEGSRPSVQWRRYDR